MRQEKSSKLIIPLVYSESIFFKAFGVSEIVNFEGQEVCSDTMSPVPMAGYCHGLSKG